MDLSETSSSVPKQIAEKSDPPIKVEITSR
jgi:hypothetical protein